MYSARQRRSAVRVGLTRQLIAKNEAVAKPEGCQTRVCIAKRSAKSAEPKRRKRNLRFPRRPEVAHRPHKPCEFPDSGFPEIRSGLLAAFGDDVIADLLAFYERAHAGAFDRADVYENVL